MSINISYIHGFLGGLLIGLAAVILFLFNGRIMGVSGISCSLLSKSSKDFWWRAAFIFGLVLGGWLWRSNFSYHIVIDASNFVLVLAGVLVGFGTVLGSGCTSGHGVCGIARFSKRSVVATIIFMLAGIVTVWFKKNMGF